MRGIPARAGHRRPVQREGVTLRSSQTGSVVSGTTGALADAIAYLGAMSRP